jgi:hypothetical protein
MIGNVPTNYEVVKFYFGTLGFVSITRPKSPEKLERLPFDLVRRRLQLCIYLYFSYTTSAGVNRNCKGAQVVFACQFISK